MPLSPPSLQIPLPGGGHYQVANNAGVTFVVGPNAVGKSFGLRKLAMNNQANIVYLPPNREVLRQGLSHVGRPEEERFHDGWNSQDLLARSWSRALRLDGLRAMAVSVLERVGLPQRIMVDRAGGGIQFRSQDGPSTYDANGEASGVLNLPTLGLAVHDPSRRTVIIDEPESSLHPQAQHVLLQLLRDVAALQDKHFILATHSPSMIDFRSSSDLARIIFIRRPSTTDPQRVVHFVPVEDCSAFETLVPHLNTYKREGLFAEAVILVEGREDRDFLRCVLEQGGYGPSLGRTSILPVDGAASTAAYAAFLRQVGVGQFSILDRDVLYPSSNMRFIPGFRHNGTIEWRGWMTPAQVRQALGASEEPQVGGPGAALREYVELNERVDVLRRAVRDLSVKAQTDPEWGTIPSVARVKDSATRLGGEHGAVWSAVFDAMLATDWVSTPAETELKAAKALWDDVCARATRLDIHFLVKGPIQAYYRHVDVGAMSKRDACNQEIAAIRAGNVAGAAPVDDHYAEIITALSRRGLIQRPTRGLTHEAAAALAGKVVELHRLLFEDGTIDQQVTRLSQDDRLEQLSPKATITIPEGSNMTEVEVTAPMLRGLLSPTGSDRLRKGEIPDWYPRLRGKDSPRRPEP